MDGSAEVAEPGASLPAAPEAVQKWLRQEDWEALTSAWQEAESQAILWAEGSDSEEVRREALLQEASQGSFRPHASMGSLPALSQTSSKKGRRRPKWNEDFHLLGQDSRRPPSLRRYFDRLPGENSVPRGMRQDVKPKPGMMEGRSGCAPPEHLKARMPWVDSFWQTPSVDNDNLHPHLRHFFDRRGLESSYRQRPWVDATTKRMRPRTGQRPTTREKIMRYRSISEGSLGQGSVMSTQSSNHDEEEQIGVEGRHTGGVNWGARCRDLGTDAYKIKQNGVTQKVPWVLDHHVSVATDNVILNPTLRHYFDVDGLESSFRNRGMHYGRQIRLPRCMEGIKPKPAETDSGWGSVHSSLLDKLSYTSLQEGGTPGGLPGIRPQGAARTGGTGSVGSNSVGGGSARFNGQDPAGQEFFDDYMGPLSQGTV